MKTSLLALTVAVAASALPSVSFADGLAFNAGVVTDYRYRGISQSRLKPAVQGGVDYAMGSFYVGAWASSIKWIKDGGGDGSVEIDLYGGYKGEIIKDSLTYDVGGLYYLYPSNKLAVSANTFEIYGALTFGPATAKYSHSVTNTFGFGDSKNSGYLDLSAGFDVGSGIMVTPHVGYQRISGVNKDYSYTDLSVTVSKDFSGLVPSIALVYTDADKALYFTPAGKFTGKTAVVLGLKYNF